MTYNAAYFAARHIYAVDYCTLAAALAELVAFKSVLDVGCGQGLLLAPLAELGKHVCGLDPHPAARAAAEPALQSAIHTASFDARPELTADLVVCLEVAEHLPAAQAEPLIASLTSRAARAICFSAASPYQPGPGHIHLRSQVYWLDLFRRRGWSLDWSRTTQLAAATAALTHARWLHHNAVILRAE